MGVGVLSVRRQNNLSSKENGVTLLHSINQTSKAENGNSPHLAFWVKNSADDILKLFSYFSKKQDYETICMNCEILFSGKK